MRSTRRTEQQTSPQTVGEDRPRALDANRLGAASDAALWQPGAYITDGHSLLEVVGRRVAYGPSGARDRVCVEDCRTLRRGEYSADKIRRDFLLVRAAPGRGAGGRRTIAPRDAAR